VGWVGGDLVRVDFFESAAEPIVGSESVPAAEIRRVRLGMQTRVFFQDGWERWRAGRVIGGGPDLYYVRLPNADFDIEVSEDRLRVRWDRPPCDLCRSCLPEPMRRRATEMRVSPSGDSSWPSGLRPPRR